MKKITFIIFTFLFNQFFAQTYTLTINNGYGEGIYKAGTRVHIFSNSYPNSNEVFTRWTSNYPTLQIDHADEWHTIITMPNSNVTLTALSDNIQGFNVNTGNFSGFTRLVVPGDTVFVNIGASKTTFGTKLFGFDTVNTPVGQNPTTQTFVLQDREIFYYLPNNMKGIVEFYHWTNGSAEGWWNIYSRFECIKNMIKEGYGVIIPQSEEKMRKQNGLTNWDINGDNLVRFTVDQRNPRTQSWTTPDLIQFIKEQFDIYQLKKVHEVLKKRQLITGNECMFGYGFSAGAAFGEMASHKLNFKATACIGNSGLEGLILNPSNNYKVPTIFSFGENDENEFPQGPYEIKNNVLEICNELTSRNVPNEWYSHVFSPIHPMRFTQVAGLTLNQSSKIFNDFVSGGATYIDSNSGQVYLKYKVKKLEDSINNFPTWKGMTQKFNEISLVCSQSNGEHCARSDFDRKIINFFNKQCDTTSNTTFINQIFNVNNKLFIYPNPIENNTVYLNFETTFRVFDSCGKMILDWQTGSKFDLENIQKGIYFIMSKDNQTYKFIYN